jgi:hypothetical protein
MQKHDELLRNHSDNMGFFKLCNSSHNFFVECKIINVYTAFSFMAITEEPMEINM